VLGHILGGTNATGDFLAKLITDKLPIGRGTGYLGVRTNLEVYHSTFFGPQAEQHGSMEHSELNEDPLRAAHRQPAGG
jgi:hypothetical protein